MVFRKKEQIRKVQDIPSTTLPLESAIIETRFIYYFAKLREIVEANEGAFKRPELILTQKSDYKPFHSTYMNNPVTFGAIKVFLKDNKGLIKQPTERGYPEFVKDGSNTCNIAMVDMMANIDSDYEIIDFDDQHSKQDLVYGIMINFKKKSISLVFRGSVTLKDWLENLTLHQSSNETITSIAKNGARVHTGFKDYLFERFSQISAVLKEFYTYKHDGSPRRDYSEYRDYNLTISGHSLGGALAQLSGFLFAGSPDFENIIPSPINTITYASPTVGDDNFYRAFRKLENANRLRHIRITNAQDAVPVAMQLVGLFFKYRQTGVNIHVNEGVPATLKYFNSEGYLLGRLSTKSYPNAHSIYRDGGYYDRLYRKDENGKYFNQEIFDKTIQELYDEHAILDEDEKDASDSPSSLFSAMRPSATSACCFPF
jgi:predicted lipase